MRFETDFSQVHATHHAADGATDRVYVVGDTMHGPMGHLFASCRKVLCTPLMPGPFREQLLTAGEPPKPVLLLCAPPCCSLPVGVNGSLTFDIVPRLTSRERFSAGRTRSWGAAGTWLRHGGAEALREASQTTAAAAPGAQHSVGHFAEKA